MKRILIVVITLTMVFSMCNMGSILGIDDYVVKAETETVAEPKYNSDQDILLYSGNSFKMEKESKDFGVTVPADEEYYISFKVQSSGEIYFDYRGNNSRLYIGQTQLGILGIASGDLWPQGDVGLSGDGVKVTIKSSGTKATIWINGKQIITDAALKTENEIGTPKISWTSANATFTDVEVWQYSDEAIYNGDEDTLKYSENRVVISSGYDFGTHSFDADTEYYVSFKAQSSGDIYFNYRGSNSGLYIGQTQLGVIGIASGEWWPQGNVGLSGDGVRVTIKSSGSEATIWINGKKIVENAALATKNEEGSPRISSVSSEATIINIRVWQKGKSDEPTYNENEDTLMYGPQTLSVEKESSSYFNVNIPNPRDFYTTMTLMSDSYINVTLRNGVYINLQPSGYSAVGVEGEDGKYKWVGKSINLKAGIKLTAYSTPKTVSVWLDGDKILDNVTIKTDDNTIKPGIGWTFKDVTKVSDAIVWVKGKETVVKVDDIATMAENGQIILGTAKYGYYSDGKMYKPGSNVSVTEGMTFASVNELSVAFDADGRAGIRLNGKTLENGMTTSGIRYQATVTVKNVSGRVLNEVLNSTAITEGMLITTNDIFENNDSNLSLTSKYKKINVQNSGWYKDMIGTYCGSIVNIIESNYNRDFIARAYAVVHYADGSDSTPVYSGNSKIRNIAGIAEAIKEDNYGGLSDEYHAIIDRFAAAKKIGGV